MTNLKKEISENGIHYTLHGDYYFPDLDLPEGSRQSIGHYGRMRKAYLEEHRPGLYTRLILSGKLYEHLAETDQVCRDRMKRMIAQMAEAEGINEKRHHGPRFPNRKFSQPQCNRLVGQGHI